MAFVFKPTLPSSAQKKKVPAFSLKDFENMTSFPFENELPDSPFAAPLEDAVAEETPITQPVFPINAGLSSSKHASQRVATKTAGVHTSEPVTSSQASSSGLSNGLSDAVQYDTVSIRNKQKQRNDAAPASFDAEHSDWFNMIETDGHQQDDAAAGSNVAGQADFGLSPCADENASNGSTGIDSAVDTGTPVENQQEMATDLDSPEHTTAEGDALKIPVGSSSPSSVTTEVVVDAPDSHEEPAVFDDLSSPTVVVLSNDGTRVVMPVDQMTRLRKSPEEFDDRYLSPRGFKRSPDRGYTEHTKEFVPSSPPNPVSWDYQVPDAEAEFVPEMTFAQMALSEIYDLVSDYKNIGTNSDVRARDALKAVQKVLNSYIEMVMG